MFCIYFVYVSTHFCLFAILSALSLAPRIFTLTYVHVHDYYLIKLVALMFMLSLSKTIHVLAHHLLWPRFSITIPTERHCMTEEKERMVKREPNDADARREEPAGPPLPRVHA